MSKKIITVTLRTYTGTVPDHATFVNADWSIDANGILYIYNGHAFDEDVIFVCGSGLWGSVQIREDNGKD